MDNLAYSDDYKNYTEMIDGEIFMMSPRPLVEHSTISSNIFVAFRSYLKGKTCRVFAGFDLYLDDKNRFIPDMMLVCDRDKIKANGVHGAPDLVVEVLSRGTYRKDRGIKKDVYEKAGVKEYWIVDTNNKTVDVYLNTDKGFQLDDVYEYHTPAELDADSKLQPNDPRKLDKIDTEIKVSIYDDLFVQLADVFEDV